MRKARGRDGWTGATITAAGVTPLDFRGVSPSEDTDPKQQVDLINAANEMPFLIPRANCGSEKLKGDLGTMPRGPKRENCPVTAIGHEDHAAKMKFKEDRQFAMPEAVEQKLLELANAMKADHAAFGRRHQQAIRDAGGSYEEYDAATTRREQRTYEWDQFDSFNERLNQWSMSRRGDL